MRKILTRRQQEILDFIEESINTRGYPPTLREIGNQFGIRSTNGVRVNLFALEKKGYIIRRPMLSRGIELVHFAAIKHAKKGEKTVNYVPLYGKVAAGEPIFANENVLQLIAIDESFITSKKVYALKVEGDSMKDAGILDGDLVLARRQHTAEPGDIIVCILSNEVTIKRYYPEGDIIRLVPENSMMEPIVVRRSSGDVQIAGKVVGVLRKY